MKKQLVIIGIVVILVIVGLSVYYFTKKNNSQLSADQFHLSQIPNDIFIGNWYNESAGMTSIFYENESICTIIGDNIFWARYKLIEDAIFIRTPDDYITENFYSFSDNNQTLTLINQDETFFVFTRQ